MKKCQSSIARKDANCSAKDKKNSSSSTTVSTIVACVPRGSAVSRCRKTQVNVAGTADDIGLALNFALATHPAVAPLLYILELLMKVFRSRGGSDILYIKSKKLLGELRSERPSIKARSSVEFRNVWVLLVVCWKKNVAVDN